MKLRHRRLLRLKPRPLPEYLRCFVRPSAEQLQTFREQATICVMEPRFRFVMSPARRPKD